MRIVRCTKTRTGVKRGANKRWIEEKLLEHGLCAMTEKG